MRVRGSVRRGSSGRGWVVAAALALGVVGLAAGRTSRAQAPSPQLFTATRLQLDVVKVLLAQQANWNGGDLEAYLGHYAEGPETVALLGTRVHGLEAIRKAFRASFPNPESMGHLENTEVEVRALGEGYALATGHYHLSRSKHGGGDADGTFTDVMEKTEKGWRIIFSENT